MKSRNIIATHKNNDNILKEEYEQPKKMRDTATTKISSSDNSDRFLLKIMELMLRLRILKKKMRQN